MKYSGKNSWTFNDGNIIAVITSQEREGMYNWDTKDEILNQLDGRNQSAVCDT